jgi:hypothetical protein
MQLDVQVVSDAGSVMAVLLRPGTPMAFPVHPFGPHPWSGQPAWAGPTVLQLYRPGDLYSVWMMFRDGQPTGSYLNFEAALTRRERAFDTVDYGLDIVIDPSGTWRFKDTEDPGAYVATGRMTTAESAAVGQSARTVVSPPNSTGAGAGGPTGTAGALPRPDSQGASKHGSIAPRDCHRGCGSRSLTEAAAGSTPRPAECRVSSIPEAP